MMQYSHKDHLSISQSFFFTPISSVLGFSSTDLKSFFQVKSCWTLLSLSFLGGKNCKSLMCAGFIVSSQERVYFKGCLTAWGDKSAVPLCSTNILNPKTTNSDHVSKLLSFLPHSFSSASHTYETVVKL